MNEICEFSVGYDNEIEEVVMYEEEQITEEQMTEIINGLVRDHRIIVGERCEGSVYLTENNTLKVKYRYCSELGEDYHNDVWETEGVEVNN